MNLNNLKKIKGNKLKSTRVGRGIGSGVGGHTTGKGNKGQNARSGSSLPFAFEGGQVPLFKRLPKIGGFRNPTKKDIVGVSINRFNVFADGATITPQDLVTRKILKKLPKYGVKILNSGKLVKKLSFSGFLFTKASSVQILKAGGKIS